VIKARNHLFVLPAGDPSDSDVRRLSSLVPECPRRAGTISDGDAGSARGLSRRDILRAHAITHQLNSIPRLRTITVPIDGGRDGKFTAKGTIISSI
jgi:hypothetical protein